MLYVFGYAFVVCKDPEKASEDNIRLGNTDLEERRGADSQPLLLPIM
jgi:hypothetical protein